MNSLYVIMLGELIVVSVSNKDVLRGFSNRNIKLGLFINSRARFRRRNGEWLRFDRNVCLLCGKNLVFRGTRIDYPIIKENFTSTITNLIKYVKYIL